MTKSGKRRPPARAASGIWWLEWLCRSHAEAEAADVLVDAAGNAEQEYAQAAHQQADAGVGPDFVNAYPKNHQRIEVRYVDAVS